VIENPRHPRLDLVPQHVAGAVRRAVVHHDDLDLVHRRSDHRLDDLLDRIDLVEDRDHHRENGHRLLCADTTLFGRRAGHSSRS
jgi:hypothetical protein